MRRLKHLLKPFLQFTVLICLLGLQHLAWAASLEVPQNINLLLNPKTENTPLISSTAQKRYSQAYLQRLFGPWAHWDFANYSRFGSQKLNVLRLEKNQISYIMASPGWDQYGDRNSKSWVSAIADNMDLDDYPNNNQMAITINNTNLRQLPTDDPRLAGANSGGEAYHFDTLQISPVWIGTPLNVMHLSTDHNWALVASAWMVGWVPFNDIAYVDDDFISSWKTGSYVSTIANKSVVDSEDNNQSFTAYVGSIFPYDKTDNNGQYHVLVPTMGANHTASISYAWVGSDAMSNFPLKATPKNFALVIQDLLGEPYDWGGSHFNSDCSAMMMKIFTPFGIWLPRSSIAQADQGHYVPLSRKSISYREKYLLKNGRPFMTLVYIKGHIMLYVGKWHNQAIIFHNIWGLGSKGHRKHFDFIGKAVITPVNLGLSSRGNINSIIQRPVFGVSTLAPHKS